METQTVNLDAELARFRSSSDVAFGEARNAGVTLKGKTLEVNLDEWLTLKRYAERYGVSIQTVSNWVARGIIPADCTQVLPELNGLRLVKNQPYF